MASADPDRELTSTLHLGLRSVVGSSPAAVIEDFYNQASAAEKEIIKAALAGDGESAMILDRKSTRLNSSHVSESRMPSSA